MVRSGSASKSRKVVFSDKESNKGEEMKEGGQAPKIKKPPRSALGVTKEDAPKLTDMGINYEAKDKSDNAVERGIPEELKQSEKGKKRDSLFFIGPSKKIYKYSILKRQWEAKALNSRAAYSGGIKQFALLTLPDKEMVLMTGGVSVATNNPVSKVYSFFFNDMTRPRGGPVKDLNQKRFGHCMAYLREKVYVFGGFAQRDV